MPKAPRSNYTSRRLNGRRNDKSQFDPPYSDFTSRQSAASSSSLIAADVSLQTEMSLIKILEDIRTTLKCSICFGLLYEPYTTACGHTYCYTCLCSWFETKNSCPDCRTTVTDAPAPAFLLREVTNKVVAHDHLLTDGESVLQHLNRQKEEADAIERDRSDQHPRTGGLFKGTFRRHSKWFWGPIRDEEDNVDRCPNCAWEMEEVGVCERCGYEDSDYVEESDTDGEDAVVELEESDLDGEVDMEDQDVEDGFNSYSQDGSEVTDIYQDSIAHHAHQQMQPQPEQVGISGRYIRERLLHSMSRHRYEISVDADSEQSGLYDTNIIHDIDDDDEDGDESDDEDEEDEEDSEMEGFIDDGEEDNPAMERFVEDEGESNNDSESSSSATTTTTTIRNSRPNPSCPPQQRRPVHVVDSDSEDVDSDSESDEGGPVSRGIARRPHPINVNA